MCFNAYYALSTLDTSDANIDDGSSSKHAEIKRKGYGSGQQAVREPLDFQPIYSQPLFRRDYPALLQSLHSSSEGGGEGKQLFSNILIPVKFDAVIYVDI
jgi:hypothetical protein